MDNARVCLPIRKRLVLENRQSAAFYIFYMGNYLIRVCYEKETGMDGNKQKKKNKKKRAY